MNNFPNTETVRHLCHFYGATKYYLLTDKEYSKPILVTNVSNPKQLVEELRSWCGMDIEVFNTSDQCHKATQAISKGTPLHLAAENMKLSEE